MGWGGSFMRARGILLRNLESEEDRNFRGEERKAHTSTHSIPAAKKRGALAYLLASPSPPPLPLFERNSGARKRSRVAYDVNAKWNAGLSHKS